MNSLSISSLVISHLRKISNLSSERINGRSGASMLLFHLCFCSFKQGEIFWNQLQDLNCSLLDILDGVKLPCSLNEFYGEAFNEIAQMQCRNLEIAAELKKHIIHNPSSVAEIIISELKGRSNDAVMPSMKQGIAELCAYIIEKNGCQSILNPFAGIGDLECALRSSTIKFNSLSTNPIVQAIASMRLEMCGKKNVIMETAHNPIEFVSQHKCDSIFLFPPLGMTATRLNSPRLEKTLIEEYLNTSDYKKCFAIVTPSFGVRREYEGLRKELVHRGLCAVIELSKGQISGTSIAPYLLVIDKGIFTGSVKFISLHNCTHTNGRNIVFNLKEAIATVNGCNSFSKEVSTVELLNSDGVCLTPGKFLLDAVIPHREGHTLYKLKDLISPIPTDRDWLSIKSPLKTVGVKDLSYNYDYMNRGVSATEETSVFATRLETDGILLTQTRTGIKMGLAKGVSSDTPLFLNRFILPFTVRPEVDAEYLLSELSSEYVRKQSEFLNVTSVTPHFFEDILVLLPALHVQTAHVSEARQKLIAHLGGAMKAAEQDLRRDVHMKRHAMGQSIGTINNWWSILEKIIASNTKNAADSATIRVSDLSLDKVLKNIKVNIKRLSTQIDKLDRGYKYNPQRLMLCSVINEYTTTYTTPVFKYDVYWQEEFSNVEIYFPKDVLFMILNNIMSNASTHGFMNRANSDNVVRIQFWQQFGTIIVSIANNGVACATDMTAQKIITYGETSNIEKHCGIGGYEAKFLMNEFGQDLEIHLNEDPEFPVEYRLIFNIYDDE